MAAASNPYDCKHDGKIAQVEVQGLVLNYCRCSDLEAGDGKYFTGPQCQYEATVANHHAPAELSLPQTEREATINQAQIGAQDENVTTSAGGGF